MLQAHKDQTRWDGRPYHVHPDKVVEILTMFGVQDDDVLCAAYLHDVLEDTDVDEALISGEFNNDVLILVKELTFEENSSDERYVEQCMELSKGARIIKIADILANITDNGHKSDHFIRKRVNALKAMLNADEQPMVQKQ